MRCAQELREALRESVDAFSHTCECVPVLCSMAYRGWEPWACAPLRVRLLGKSVVVLVLVLSSMVLDINSTSIWEQDLPPRKVVWQSRLRALAQAMPWMSGMPACHARLIDRCCVHVCVCCEPAGHVCVNFTNLLESISMRLDAMQRLSSYDYDFSQSPSPLEPSKQPIRAALAHGYFQESSDPCSTPLPAPAATRD
jgi:hypothetical protein